MSDLEDALRARVVGNFSQDLLTGALRVVGDKYNPVRHGQFSSTMRELMSHTLHVLSPDECVTACSWYKKEADKVTRRQRAKYATQGGLSDKYIGDIGVDVKEVHDRLIEAIEEMNKYTHLRPENVVQDQIVIDQFVEEAMSALLGLFSAIDECRATVIGAVEEQIDDQTVDKLVGEAIDDIDILATHYHVETVLIDHINVDSITATTVSITATGTVDVKLEYGSGSDMERGDGATIDESFPFKVSFEAPVGDPSNIGLIDHAVDNSAWFGSQGEG